MNVSVVLWFLLPRRALCSIMKRLDHDDTSVPVQEQSENSSKACDISRETGGYVDVDYRAIPWNIAGATIGRNGSCQARTPTREVESYKATQARATSGNESSRGVGIAAHER